ncbi:MAG TPA: carboxypeptidase-like regulatory domain-containing protein [Arenibacter sp.]|nr:carboxypeptidase-like regulatory domain-containing protein [Arenibacter sp.]
MKCYSMPRNHNYIIFLFCLLLPFLPMSGKAQVISPKKTPLITYLEQLEQKYHIKFSYIDTDLQPLAVTVPTTPSLPEILQSLRFQTNLDISRLNDRYYTITKNALTELCGLVLDNYGKNVIMGATVEVLGGNVHMVTDKAGYFKLKGIPREAQLAIRHLGYKTRYLRTEELLKKDSCTTILLLPDYQELEEVVVYQFLTSGIGKGEDARIDINTEKFGILPGLTEPDVLQTVQALPGIKSVDETVSDINVRGGTNDQNLILWDGIKMYQSGHFFGLISAFNPYLTKEVALIKNGTSVEYGDGVSSVIDIRSKNKVARAFVGGAGFNLLSGDVYGHLPLTDKVSFQFSGRRSITDFIKTPLYDQFYKKAFQDSDIEENNGQGGQNIGRNEDFYFYDVSGRILYDINEDQKVRLSFIQIYDHLHYNEKIGNSDDRSLLKQDNLSFGGSLESTWSPNFHTHLNLYYTRYDLDSQDIPSEVQQLHQNNQVLEKALKLNTYYTMGHTMEWLNGYQLNEVGITNFTQVTRPAFRSNIKGVIMTHSLFSELAYTSMDKKWFARGGMRFNYIKNLKTFSTFDAFFIEPRLNLSYALTKNLKIELLGEFKSQTTNQVIDLEQNFLGIEKRRWLLSNEQNLPITKSKQASVGFNYENRSLYMALEGFYKEVNGVSTTTQGFQNKDQFNGEIGGYHISGLEFLINKKTPTYSTWLSYTYNLNNYYFDGLTPHKFPNNLDIRHTFTLAGTYTHKSFRVGLGANYRTGKPYTRPLEGDNAIDSSVFPNMINYARANGNRLPDYLRLDASFIYHFNLGELAKASIGTSVLNILDKKNILNTYSRLNDQNQLETIDRISLGITPNLSFRVSF